MLLKDDSGIQGDEFLVNCIGTSVQRDSKCCLGHVFALEWLATVDIVLINCINLVHSSLLSNNIRELLSSSIYNACVQQCVPDLKIHFVYVGASGRLHVVHAYDCLSGHMSCLSSVAFHISYLFLDFWI